MRNDIKCSRCGFVIHGNDLLYENRKKRHVGWHSLHTTKSQRDGSIVNKAGKGYVDIGEVKWITIW